MNILHVFDFFSPHGGGTIDAIYKLSKAQAQSGHDVSLFTSDFKLDKAYIASIPEVKIRLFHCVSPLFGFYLMPGIIKAARETPKNYDVIHLHCSRSFQNIVLCHYANKYKIPYVLDTHGSMPRMHGKKGLKWLLKWCYDVVIGYRILKSAAIAIAESQVGVAEYKQYGLPENKIVVIPSPIDTAEFSALPPRGTFRDKHNLQGKHLIIFLGRLHWIKGVDFLVEAFAALSAGRDDLVLVIVGNDDGYKSTLDLLIARLGIREKVIFTGFLSGPDKLAALVDADMMVQPSRYEQGVRVAYEALLCGTPVIVTSGTGPGEIIEKTGGGWVVDYGSLSQLQNTLQYILDNRAEALSRTKKAREYIAVNLSVKSGAEKFIALYRQIL